jgi:hypothetical protein
MSNYALHLILVFVLLAREFLYLFSQLLLKGVPSASVNIRFSQP